MVGGGRGGKERHALMSPGQRPLTTHLARRNRCAFDKRKHDTEMQSKDATAPRAGMRVPASLHYHTISGTGLAASKRQESTGTDEGFEF